MKKKINKARNLFSTILPILSFTHQHIDIAIKFSKILRVREQIFTTDLCRLPISEFDIYQSEEANIHIEKVISLQNNIN